MEDGPFLIAEGAAGRTVGTVVATHADGGYRLMSQVDAAGQDVSGTFLI